jgi:iron complex transport system substrate-binding protein
MSPAITEILYELGLGDKIVGVTNHCNFPEDAKSKFRIGGYLDTNYEAIILLEPDMVIASDEYSSETKNLFKNTEIEYIKISIETTGDIFAAIKQIGRRNGVEDRAGNIVARMCKDIVMLKNKVKKKPERRVMIVIGRDEGSFDNLYIAGQSTFYNELLNILGCKNVYTKSDIRYPTISLEAVMRWNPDVIIEMRPNLPEGKKTKIITQWSSLKDINAVKNSKVYVLNGDYVCMPSPRLTLILEDIADLL